MGRPRKNRRHRQASEEGQERWLVSYADFITLMFAFFVVLYATSERDLEKTKDFQKSIKKFFVQVTGGGVGEVGSSVKRGSKKDSPIKPPLPTFKTSSDAAQLMISQIEEYIDEYVNQDEREKYLIDLSHDILGVRLSLNASFIYLEDSILFNKRALSFIDKVSNLISKIEDPIIVESHTDKKSSRPKPIDNDWNLSSLRSSQFVNYLIKRHKVSSSRLAAMGHGSERPLFSQNDPGDSRKNQRLELLIITEESPF